MGSKKTEDQASRKVKVSLQALRDIDSITGYIAFVNHQPENAIRVGDKIFETIHKIGKNPFAFRECEEIPTKNKSYRKAVCQSWLIIYKIKSEEVLIVSVIHSSRRPARIKSFKKAQ